MNDEMNSQSEAEVLQNIEALLDQEEFETEQPEEEIDWKAVKEQHYPSEAQPIQPEKQEQPKQPEEPKPEPLPIAAMQNDIAEATHKLFEDAQAFDREWGNVDWTRLEQQHPEEARALKEQYRNQKNDLVQRGQAIKKAGEQVETYNQQQWHSAMEAETAKIIGRVPEWADNNVKQKELTAINSYLQSQGFTPEEINMIADHRLALVMRDAWLYNNRKETPKQEKRESPNMDLQKKFEQELKKRRIEDPASTEAAVIKLQIAEEEKDKPNYKAEHKQAREQERHWEQKRRAHLKAMGIGR